MRRTLLLVGCLVASGCLGTPPSGPPSADAPGPAAAPPRDRWLAEGCAGLSLVWTPPLDALQQVVGPRWTPAEGPVPGRGLFVLFAVACQDTLLNGSPTGPLRLGASIVRLADPQDAPPVEAPDGWSAVPDFYGDASDEVLAMFARLGWPVRDGEASVAVAEAGPAVQATMALADGAGRVEATAALTGPPALREVHGVLPNTDPERFAVFTGPETMQRQGTGSAVVQASGDSWVSRLGLEPRPFAVALDTAFGWDFEVWSQPWPTP